MQGELKGNSYVKTRKFANELYRLRYAFKK
jgi:hypothetical protein